jgi:hypothetical protein
VKSGYLRQITGPQIVTRFSDSKYGNYYVLKPIRAGPASTRLKVLLTLWVPKTLRSITRSLLELEIEIAGRVVPPALVFLRSSIRTLDTHGSPTEGPAVQLQAMLVCYRTLWPL